MAWRRLPVVVLLAAALLLPARAGAATGGGDNTAIAIAVVAMLSGPDALGPQDAVDGFTLGMKQLTQRLGNQEARVVVVDAKDGVESAMAAVDRLREHGRIDFVLTALSQSAFAAILPALTAGRTFVINLGEMPAALAGAGCSPWVFDLAGPADGIDLAAGVQLGLDGIKRLAVVAPDSPPARDAVAALGRTFPGEVVATLLARHGATTYGAETAQLRRLHPDAVYDLLGGGMNVEFMRALDDGGLRDGLAVYAPWPAFERAYLPAMGESALDVVTFGTWAGDLDNPATHRLVADFEAEYGRPATTWAAAGYDAATLLDAALTATKGRTGDADALRNALRNAGFASTRGSFRFNTDQGPVLSYLARKVVRDARGRLVNQSQGVVVKDWRDPAAAACPMRWEPAPPAGKPAASPAH